MGGGYALQVLDGPLLHLANGTESVIDPGGAAIDLMETTLFGRTGLLVSHRGMQLRFYEPGSREGGGWPYREIYSFYTNSEQGGLLARDVDGDGRPDLFCGNYWVKSPRVFEEPWRLFAINLFHEEPLSASARLAWHGERLLWVESKQPSARAAWFTPPTDPSELWIEERIPETFRHPRGVASSEGRIWIAEAHPAAPRIWEWPRGRWRDLSAPAASLIASSGPSGEETLHGVDPDGNLFPIRGL
jgi:hypothetical protein